MLIQKTSKHISKEFLSKCKDKPQSKRNSMLVSANELSVSIYVSQIV